MTITDALYTVPLAASAGRRATPWGRERGGGRVAERVAVYIPVSLLENRETKGGTRPSMQQTHTSHAHARDRTLGSDAHTQTKRSSTSDKYRILTLQNQYRVNYR